jgi:hypothetical protein
MAEKSKGSSESKKVGKSLQEKRIAKAANQQSKKAARTARDK